jgi:hypothetical protein
MGLGPARLPKGSEHEKCQGCGAQEDSADLPLCQLVVGLCGPCALFGGRLYSTEYRERPRKSVSPEGKRKRVGSGIREMHDGYNPSLSSLSRKVEGFIPSMRAAAVLFPPAALRAPRRSSRSNRSTRFLKPVSTFGPSLPSPIW